MLAFLCLVWTVFAYIVAKYLFKKYGYFWLNPIITVSTVTIVLMLRLGISYDTYRQDTDWIPKLIAPATVAFAVPIYEYRRLIAKNIGVLSISIFVGMFVGVVSAYMCAKLFDFDQTLTHSMMARSISTPFAIDLAEQIHGSSSLVTLFTLMTGSTGIVIGDMVLAISRIRFHLANGVAFGNSSHGFGTARATQRHESEGVIASLTMILAGLFMVFAGSSLVKLVDFLGGFFL